MNNPAATQAVKPMTVRNVMGILAVWSTVSQKLCLKRANAFKQSNAKDAEME